jgi:hypothetical protein
MKKIIWILVIVIIGSASYFVLREDQEMAGNTQDQSQEVENVRVVEGEDFTVELPDGWTATLELNELDARVSFLRLRSPDFLDGSSEYSVMLRGTQIAISKFTGSRHNSIAEFAASINPEVLASTPIQHTTVAGEPAVRYYWAWEGDPALITAFFHNGAHYGIGLSAAKVPEVPSGFDVYLPLYQKVVDSFEFK